MHQSVDGHTASSSIPRFTLGRIVATPGALAAMERNGRTGIDFLNRHARGEWGDVSPEDAAANEDALAHRSRLLSAYRLNDQTRIWIITEADRSSTCILLPNEY